MTVLLVLPAVLATLFMSACDSAPRCELRLATREWQANDCRAADADGDGIDELLILDEASISARNLDLTFDWQVPSPIPDEARCHLFPRSAGRESSPQFAITASVPESLLLFMSGRRSVLDCRRQPRNSRATWDVDFLGADSADLNADGENDLVVSIGSGYAWPWLGRGVYAVDGRTSRLLWRYGLGPVPHAPVIADVNRDGQPEILISTGAVGNGCIENGTADTCAYVLCLDGLGRQLWSRPVRFGSGAWTEVEAADLDGDGRPEVFTVENSCVADSTMGSIMLLNPDDGSILARRQVDSIQGCHVVGDLDADGRQEIVTSTRNGVVTVRGLGLEPIRSVPLSDGIDWVGACDHLLGTKQRQFAVVTQAGALKVLDHRLRTLATISLSRIVEEVRPVHTGTNTPMGLLVATAPYLRGSYQDNWILLRLHILRNPFPWAVLTGILAVLLAVAGWGMVYVRVQHRRQMRGLARGLVQKAGVVELDRKGRVLAANDYARQLLGLEVDAERQVLLHTLTAPEFSSLRETLQRLLAGADRHASVELPLPVEGGVRTFRARVARVRFGGFFLSLEDLSAAEYARRISAWGPVAQRLAHGIKTPLSTIRLKAQQMEEDGVSDAKTIQEEADRLSRMTDGFMRLASFEPLKLEEKDLNVVVQRVIGEQSARLVEGLELRLQLASDLPKLQIDEEQVVRALANLVSNAVAAMDGKGVLTIRTRATDDGSRVLLEVSDTGPGIPEEYRTKLFQPFFTRKPGGTGLGLTIVKKTIEDHGGTIEVDSEVGRGTTFRVVLPTADKSKAQSSKDKAEV